MIKIKFLCDPEVQHCGKCPGCRRNPGNGSGDSVWPAKDVVAKLLYASDLLFEHYDYDGDGWEQLHTAREIAREWVKNEYGIGESPL